MQIKGNERKSTPINVILTAGISMPIGGALECPIFITARCKLEMGACRWLSLDF
jgi:hypothetical protein